MRAFELIRNDFWSPSVESWLDEVTAPFREGRGQVFTPACDLEETESHYLLSLDLPGVTREDIKIETVKDQLLVAAERKAEKSEKTIHLKERGRGTFYRAFSLGSAVDAERIEALYQDGVLRIAVPKAESAKPRLIAVKGDATEGFFGKPETAN
jgi:HSP20 family protein